MSNTIQKISALAKKIYKANPKKKWVDCIKLASKQLKSGKVGDYKINRAEFSETRLPMYPRKKTEKKPRKFAVVRNSGGQFEKIKRISGTGNESLIEIGRYKKLIAGCEANIDKLKKNVAGSSVSEKKSIAAKIKIYRNSISNFKKIVAILKKNI